MADICIRLLTSADWQLWKAIRLQALKDSPQSFGSSYEETLLCNDQYFKEMLEGNDIFAAFDGSNTVGCVGFSSLKSVKTAHRGMIWGMYTSLAARGKGVAKQLMHQVIKHAADYVTQLHLHCVTENTVALALYQKFDFETYGTEPKSIKVHNQFYDQYLMVLELA
ncbi:GNAT family N-acetyltransferase [Cysteiniphilum sp. QT6929]|uniref:GNAT family N-acetyltransferase n=1 Tax=Cysteiniphilum sp. QT6929 TaxID=2975055 RepID=UPI0024B32C55|nr:GNAT family N-acetyltransferase [Cysteiniphilum sp. QT6929]WHN66247.1 GNAT family N-acetyltransferase [Cysteiniphilum sp. QT6929]